MSTLVGVAANYTSMGNYTGALTDILSPISFGGALWFPLIDQAAGQVDMFTSVDGGSTWAQVSVGPSDTPGTSCMVAAFDGHHIITVALVDAAANPTSFSLYDFDLATNTWGAAYGTSTSASNNYGWGFAFLLYQSTGDLVLGYSDFTTTEPFYGIYSGSWTFAALDTNVPTTSAQNISAVIDSTDAVHTFFWNNSAAEFVYQQITAAGTLGPFFVLPAAVYSSSGTLYPTPGQPAIDTAGAGFLILPVGDTLNDNPAVIVGTPLANPVTWTFVALDAANTGVGNTGYASFDGTTVFVAMSVDTVPMSGDQMTVGVYKTTNLADPTLGWTGALNPFAFATANPLVSPLPSLSPSFTFTTFSTDPVGEQYAFLQSSPPPPPPPGPFVASSPIINLGAMPGFHLSPGIDGGRLGCFEKPKPRLSPCHQPMTSTPKTRVFKRLC